MATGIGVLVSVGCEVLLVVVVRVTAPLEAVELVVELELEADTGVADGVTAGVIGLFLRVWISTKKNSNTTPAASVSTAIYSPTVLTQGLLIIFTR